MQPSTQPKKTTTSQLWFIHALEFYVYGAAFGLVVNIYGALQSGKLDLSSLAVMVGLAFSGLIANIHKGILQNANMMQAVSDTFGELRQSHNTLAHDVGSLIGMVTGLFHLHSAQQQSAQPAPIQQQASPAQATIPARPQFAAPPALTQFSTPLAAIGSQQAQQGQ